MNAQQSESATPSSTPPTELRVGDPVKKPKGYSFDGYLLATFTTTAGETRHAVELLPGNVGGMLHIFSPSQVERRDAEPVTLPDSPEVAQLREDLAASRRESDLRTQQLNEANARAESLATSLVRTLEKIGLDENLAVKIEQETGAATISDKIAAHFAAVEKELSTLKQTMAAIRSAIDFDYQSHGYCVEALKEIKALVEATPANVPASEQAAQAPVDLDEDLKGYLCELHAAQARIRELEALLTEIADKDEAEIRGLEEAGCQVLPKWREMAKRIRAALSGAEQAAKPPTDAATAWQIIRNIQHLATPLHEFHFNQKAMCATESAALLMAIEAPGTALPSAEQANAKEEHREPYDVDDRGNVVQFYSTESGDIVATLDREAVVNGVPDQYHWDGGKDVTEWAMTHGYAPALKQAAEAAQEGGC